jgi:hypothetical protein
MEQENELHKDVFQGHIYGADEGGLHIGNDAIAEEVAGSIGAYGSFLTIQYYIATQPICPDTVKLDWLKQLYTGFSDTDYHIAWSEITGYLWTDEELNVGGHDLLAELYTHEGKYIYMEIKYSKEEVQDGTGESTDEAGIGGSSGLE